MNQPKICELSIPKTGTNLLLKLVQIISKRPDISADYDWCALEEKDIKHPHIILWAHAICVQKNSWATSYQFGV
jgi:hypothetical protein